MKAARETRTSASQESRANLWGCEKLCPASSLACGNGTIRTPHPVELFGEDWLEWEKQRGNPKDDSRT